MIHLPRICFECSQAVSEVPDHCGWEDDGLAHGILDQPLTPLAGGSAPARMPEAREIQPARVPDIIAPPQSSPNRPRRRSRSRPRLLLASTRIQTLCSSFTAFCRRDPFSTCNDQNTITRTRTTTMRSKASLASNLSILLGPIASPSRDSFMPWFCGGKNEEVLVRFLWLCRMPNTLRAVRSRI
jgi:hypothetical protein